MALFTGKGDSGTTKFFSAPGGSASGGESMPRARVSKNHPIAETLGLLDELNSFIGLCKVRARDVGSVAGSSIYDILEEAQENLFIVQAEVAGSAEKKIVSDKIKKMEEVIHAAEKEIPPITSFTIAGGSELSALLDVARTIARKAERTAVGLCDSGERKICDDARAYLNRLSSLLFALARLVNHRAGIKEKSPSYK